MMGILFSCSHVRIVPRGSHLEQILPVLSTLTLVPPRGRKSLFWDEMGRSWLPWSAFPRGWAPELEWGQCWPLPSYFLWLFETFSEPVPGGCPCSGTGSNQVHLCSLALALQLASFTLLPSFSGVLSLSLAFDKMWSRPPSGSWQGMGPGVHCVDSSFPPNDFSEVLWSVSSSKMGIVILFCGFL